MAETTTISNLPQITIDELTNDTLVPVENVDGTKAANLAQLRKKLNSLYVEMVDADLNELKQDGIYECWGTTLNAPTSEVAAWIIQTAEHEGVVVQNAFGLGTTSYSYVYRRRWNGVSWTAWENKIQTLETVKANVANTVTTDTAQTISGSKRFTQPSAGMSIELVADTNQQTVPAKLTGRQLGLYRNATYTKGDGYTSWVRGYRGSDGLTGTELYTRRFLEGDSQEIINYIKAIITSDGTPASYTKTPPAFCVGEEIVTAGWFRQSGCTARTVIETYRNGRNWYRVWSDGWIEQGGFAERSQVNVSQGVTFLKKFVDNSYTSLAIVDSFDTDGYNYFATTAQDDATGSRLTIYTRGYGGTVDARRCHWYACGY